jgi:predicted ATPase
LLTAENSKDYELSIDLNFETIFCKKPNFKQNFINHSLVAVFDYKTLLKSPISIKTFAKIARNHHIVCISNFTSLTHNNEDEAIRFRDLIDMLYLRSCFIIILFENITNETLTQTLVNFANTFEYINNNKHQNFDTIKTFSIFDKTLLEKKEFIRCESRLNEMQSYAYINNHLRYQKRQWCDKARDMFESL